MLHTILIRVKKEGIKTYMTPHIDKILSLLEKIDKNIEKDFYESITRFEFKKGDFLINEGTLPKQIWFIETGIARKYINRDGVDISQHFYCSGEFVFLYTDYIFHKNTTQNIQFLNDSVVYSMKWEVFDQFKIRCPIFNQIEVIVLAAYIGWLEQKINLCQQSSAKNKYNYLKESQAHLLELVPHHYIASYLDITRETLSRIRKEHK